MFSAGGPKFGWLKRLKASARNFRFNLSLEDREVLRKAGVKEECARRRASDVALPILDAERTPELRQYLRCACGSAWKVVDRVAVWSTLTSVLRSALCR